MPAPTRPVPRSRTQAGPTTFGDQIMSIRRQAAFLVAVCGTACGCAYGQASVDVQPTGQSADGGTVVLEQMTEEEIAQFAQHQKLRSESEKELKKLRYTYFRGVRNKEIRQIGIQKMRQYTEAALYLSLIEIFRGEDEDVRNALLDHFFDMQNELADATLAWIAVFDKDESLRTGATKRLLDRIKEDGEVSRSIQGVIARGLRTSKEDEMASAAGLANELSLYQAIPALISAQVTPRRRSSTERDPNSVLGSILVATQRAYVSDLTPIVGDSAVAFDPQLSVVTDGVYLQISDAAVTIYHGVVHNALVDLSSRAWGQSTRRLGWDPDAWRDWYNDDYLPYLTAKNEQESPDNG